MYCGEEVVGVFDLERKSLYKALEAVNKIQETMSFRGYRE